MFMDVLAGAVVSVAGVHAPAFVERPLEAPG